VKRIFSTTTTTTTSSTLPSSLGNETLSVQIGGGGGIGIVEMLFRCNLIALVGGGRSPRFPTNKVMIWDDHQSKCIGELMFKSEVLAVRLRRDRVVVLLQSKVYVYRFSDLKLLDQISTTSNPKGLICLCSDPANNVLAIPGLAKGSIRVEHYDISKTTIIKAHDTELSQMALNIDGSRLASASEKGTLIRLWDTATGDALREFRRGMDRAEIYCICFDPITTFLACSSDKGTIHIFSLADPSVNVAPNPMPSNNAESPRLFDSTLPTPPLTGDGPIIGTDMDNKNESSNKSLSLGFLRGVLPPSIVPKYLNSEWSFAQVRGIDGKSVCVFDKTSSKLYIVCSDGTLTVANIEQGECVRTMRTNFLS
jgi:WD40 repeat protein